MDELALPTTSEGSYPYNLRAPSFHSKIFPSRSFPMIEYSVEDSRILAMKSTASCGLPTMALSKSLAFRVSSVKRISWEMSLEMSRNPMALPWLSCRGVITTRALMRRSSLRTRPRTPSHFPSLSAASMISRGFPLAT
jgi:hypothetical protein